MSQNVFQLFAITDFKSFQQKVIDALLSDKDVYLSVKTIVRDLSQSLHVFVVVAMLCYLLVPCSIDVSFLDA